jgi:hypothetical protein
MESSHFRWSRTEWAIDVQEARLSAFACIFRDGQSINSPRRNSKVMTMQTGKSEARVLELVV